MAMPLAGRQAYRLRSISFAATELDRPVNSTWCKPLNEIAEVTAYFWMIKIFATTLGEMSVAMLSQTLDRGYVVGFLLTGLFLIAMVVLQVRADRYHVALFWATIVGTTMVGTEISDMMDRTFGLGYVWGSMILLPVLLVTRRFGFAEMAG